MLLSDFFINVTSDGTWCFKKKKRLMQTYSELSSNGQSTLERK